MKFSDFVVREAILTDLQATTKEGAIREIVRSLHHAGALKEADPEHITRYLLDREEIGSTGIGHGVACPETRHPAVDHVVGSIALSRRGIEWGAWDGDPVYILFLLISNLPGQYLRVMEIFNRHLDIRFVTRLYQAQTREQIIDLLEEADQEPLEEADQRPADLPSQDELMQLPLRALVAYAARCARRVQPFCTLPCFHPEEQQHIAAEDRAIRIAEEFARGIPVAVADAVQAARAAQASSGVGDKAAYTAADAAPDSAGAAVRAAWAAADQGASVCWFNAARRSIAAAVRMDFSRLRGLELGRFPELGEPIDPSENGPLGPLWPGEKRGAVAHPQEEWKFGGERT